MSFDPVDDWAQKRPSFETLSARPAVSVIGGGPAGLMAAEVLSAAGAAVTLYEKMPSLGRKFLMAGRGGLNLTHSEDFPSFLRRYNGAAGRLEPAITAFPPAALRAWAELLGQQTFVGSSGRVFPVSLKASPLLRAWLRRLHDQGVEIRTGREWLGWDAAGKLMFRCPDGAVETVGPEATILALGGASWPRLGADGGWAKTLSRHDVAITPFKPANCGFVVGWTDPFKDRFAGAPLKNVAFSFEGRTVRGEAMLTSSGIEGGVVYALSAALRDALLRDGSASPTLDMRPDTAPSTLAERLKRLRPGESQSNRLRKAAGLQPPQIGLMREAVGRELPRESERLAALIKSVPIAIIAPQPIERAISTAGGVSFAAIDARFMLNSVPGAFVAGEMLDWEAPTGGYLLQACFATGAAAAHGALAWLRVPR